jgi:hypothetical protein
MRDAFTDKNEQEMLTLAVASYYGLWIPHLGEAGAAPSAGIIAAALATLEPLGGRWELAWGPVSLRSTFGLLDDVLAFVARDVGDPARYAVALRGTNPLSLTDWIFGDGWVLFDEAWGRDQPERISRSSGLGLAVVKNLRAVPAGSAPEAGWLQSLGERLEEAEAGLEEGARRVLRRVEAALTGGAVAEEDRLHVGLDDAWVRGLDGRMEAAARRLEKRAANALGAVEDGLEAALEGDRGAFDAAAYAHTLAALELREEDPTEGALTLAEFLRGAGEKAGGPLNVWVTGHSKGAALATAVAMWLEEAREAWDPSARAALRCTTFAGPTVGNDAFAARVARVLGDRHRRVANRHDLVTEGWSFAALDRATALYRDRMPEGFFDLVRAMAEEVRPLKYTHVVDPGGSFEGADGGRGGGPLGQMIHQHLNAYIVNAGLSPEAFDLRKVMRATRRSPVR